MTTPLPRGPVHQALQDWLAAPSDDADHTLAAVTASLSPACDVLTDDDVHGALRVMYVLARGGPGVSVTGLQELPPLIRARVSLESAFEFELRVRTAHHVAVAFERREALGCQVLHLLATMHGPALPAYLERHATRQQVADYVHLRGGVEGPIATLDELPHDVPGHVLAAGNAHTMFGLHPRLRGCALGFEAARAASTAASAPRVAAACARVGLTPPAGAVPAPRDESTEPRTLVDAALGPVADDAPDHAADVLLGAASHLYLEAVSDTRLLERWRDGDRYGDPVGA